VKLQQKIKQWQFDAAKNFDEANENDLFNDCIVAITVGWNDDTLKHILVGDIPLMVPGVQEANNNNNAAPVSSEEEEEAELLPIYLDKESSVITEARIDALCLLGKTKEAVNLSTASGEHFKAAELLLAHGKVEQAVTEALKQHIEPANAIKFAKAIRDQDPTGAFCVAVIGLKTFAPPVAFQTTLHGYHAQLIGRAPVHELGLWTLDFVLNLAKKKKTELGRQKSALAITNEPMEVETIVIDDEAVKSSTAANTVASLADLASQSCVTILAEQEMGSVKRVLDSVPPEIQERLMLDILVELADREIYYDIRSFMWTHVDTLLKHKLLMPALRVLIAVSKTNQLVVITFVINSMQSTKLQFSNLRRAIDVASMLGSSYLIETVSKCLKNIANMRRIESEDALALAIHLLDKGFPRGNVQDVT